MGGFNPGAQSHLVYEGDSSFGGVGAPGPYSYIFGGGSTFHAQYLGTIPANVLAIQARFVVTAVAGNAVPNIILYQKVPGLHGAPVASQYFSYHGAITVSKPTGAVPNNIVLNGIFGANLQVNTAVLNGSAATNYLAVTGPGGYPIYATTSTSNATGTTQTMPPALDDIMVFAFNPGINTNTWTATCTVQVVFPPA